MRKQVLTGLLCIGAVMASNLKSDAQSTIIYYWDFNAADSAIHAPFYTAAGAGSATYNYICAYTDYTSGSSVNVMSGDIAGDCIRFRDPADSVTFLMPTTGFHDIQFSYSEQRTGSGSMTNTVLYSTDGTHFIPTIDPTDSSTYTVDSTDATVDTVIGWQLKTYSFSADTLTNNNSHFAIRIIFLGVDTATSGNDRFDNVSLKQNPSGTSPSGVTAVVANAGNYTLYPNPATNTLTVTTTNDDQKSFAIYNVMGQKVSDGVNNGKSFTVNTANFVTGMYYINISDNATGNVTALKFVKQ